jgi:hypothetical protein
MAQLIQVGNGTGLTALAATMRPRITDTPCGPSAKRDMYANLLEAFCMAFAVKNIAGQVNKMCMVMVPPNLKSGTVVTMSAANLMDSDRPKDGYRIDLQHYNTKDPDGRIRDCADFQIQTNTSSSNIKSNSLAEVHIQPNVQFYPSDIIDAFTQSLTNTRAYVLTR